MIIRTSELIKKGETEYSIRKMLNDGNLFKIEKGMYSTNKEIEFDEVYFSKKYPDAILTGLSAYSYFELTDSVPEFYYFATRDNSLPIKESCIKQSYQQSEIFLIGIDHFKIGEETIKIYDKERMLIELFRLRAKYPSDLFYEVLSSYRGIRDQLDFGKITDYLTHFKNGDTLAIKIKEALI